MFGFHTIAFVLLLAAFVFTLLALISGPVASTLVLAEAQGTKYGIFGYISGSEKFQGYPIHFADVARLPKDWVLSEEQRTNCAKAFVLAPIACGFSFFAAVAYLAGHFARGGRIAGVVLNVIACLCLIAICVLVVLVYHPHVGAIGWLTVAAAGCALVALVPGILSLFFGGGDHVRDDTSLYDENSNNYDGQKLDDKFGHVQTNVISLPHTNTNENRPYAYQPQPQVVARPGNVRPINGQPKYLGESKLTKNSLVDLANGAVPPLMSDGHVSGLVNPHTVVPQLTLRVTPITANGGATPHPYAQSTQYSHNLAVRNPGSGAATAAGAAVGTTNIVASANSNANNTTNNGTTPYPTGLWGPQAPQPRPLSDLDEFDDEDNLVGAAHGGYPLDSDSDFTSVSQRAPNPNYEQPPAPPPHRGTATNPVPLAYPQNQPFYQPQSPVRSQGQPYHGQVRAGFDSQPSRPTVLEQALNSNPDFNFPQSRRRQAGFVPVAARYKPQAAGRPAAGNRSGFY